MSLFKISFILLKKIRSTNKLIKLSKTIGNKTDCFNISFRHIFQGKFRNSLEYFSKYALCIDLAKTPSFLAVSLITSESDVRRGR